MLITANAGPRPRKEFTLRASELRHCTFELKTVLKLDHQSPGGRHTVSVRVVIGSASLL